MEKDMTIPSLGKMAEKIEAVLIHGDIASLTMEEKVSYYKRLCETVGLNPLTKPFEYIKLKNKLVLYALRTCTDQLRNIHGISIQVTSRELIGDIFTVTVQATNAQGRTDSSIGAVSIERLVGEDLANAYMKAETKAKRRVTLSMCGLGLLDETEVASIPDCQPIDKEKTSTKITTSDTEYIIPFGKYKGLTFSQVETEELKQYSEYIKHKAETENKPIRGTVKEFLERADKIFLATDDEIERLPGDECPF